MDRGFINAEIVRMELESLKRWAGDQNRVDPMANAWATQVEMWCKSKLEWLDKQQAELDRQAAQLAARKDSAQEGRSDAG